MLINIHWNDPQQGVMQAMVEVEGMPAVGDGIVVHGQPGGAVTLTVSEVTWHARDQFLLDLKDPESRRRMVHHIEADFVTVTP